MRGRNQKLIARRDRAMAARYYYWTEIQRRRYDDVLYIIENHEFFVGKQTIGDVLREQNDYINDLITKKTSIVTLCEKFPAFSWTKKTTIAGH